MSWIESHQTLERHPKTLYLVTSLSIPLDTAIGRLHRFWWWSLDYALDGDLSRFSDAQIESACNIPVKNLIEAGFLEESRKIHDWLDYAGRFIRIKYKNYPEKIAQIQKLHHFKNKGTAKGTPKNPPKPTNLTDLTNQTRPNLTNHKNKDMIFEIPNDLLDNLSEINDWLEYKRQKGQMYKPKGLEALWRSIRLIPKDKRREAVDHSMSNNWSGLFQKNGGNNGRSNSSQGSDETSGKYDGIVKRVSV